MGQRYPYSTRCDTNIEPIIHIYGTRAIFLIFIDNQDTKYESQVLQHRIFGPIFKHKTPKPLWDNYIHSLQDTSTICW